MPEEPARSYAVPAVDGMLDLVEFLAGAERPYGISELARQLGLSHNMAFRILRRLQERRYAEVDAATGGYRLGTAFLTLGMRLHGRFELRLRARAPLEALAAACGETCQIQIPDGEGMVVLDCACPATAYFLQVVPGSRLHWHANAFGKAVLALLPEEERRRLLPARLPALTPATLTTAAALRRELEVVAASGLAYDREEYSLGIRCLGAPVLDAGGRAVAGLGITGLASRFDAERQRECAAQVLRCAAEVAAAIGHTGGQYRDWLGALPA
jgi:DNA-binding IclR family transcriptional regulator